MKTLVILFYSFFKIGLFAVGGGLATLPFLTELSLQYPEWFVSPALGDIVAIAESTPGPIGVNASTFAGYCAAGIPGAVVATVSLVLPSIIVITLIAGVLEKYQNSQLVQSAFSGLRPAVAGLIAASAYSLVQLAVLNGAAGGSLFSSIDWLKFGLFVALLIFMQLKPLKKLHPALFIVFGAVIGLVFQL